MMRRLNDLGYTHEYTDSYTLHFAVAEHRLPYYLDEFTFRFNRRNSHSRGLLFYRLLQQAVDTEPQPL